MLRMFESTILRKVFGPMEDVVMGDWRKMHNVELCELYASPTIIWVTRSRKMRWVGNVAHMGKPEAKRPLRRPSHSWEDNTELFLNEMGKEGLNCISLSQAMGWQWAFVKIVICLQFPYSAGGLLDCWLPEKDPDSYSWLVN
jgi:hypothetical protein